MNKTTIANRTATTLSSLVTISQTNEIFQQIQRAISILCGILTLVASIYGWYKTAKQDGKITKDEIEELGDILKNKGEKHDKKE